MAILGIKNVNPNARIIRGWLGEAIRFTAARFVGKRYPWEARKLAYNIGSEAHPNVEVRETAKAKQFFRENNVDGSRKCVAAVFQKDTQGKITGMRWVSIGKFKGFIWSYLKPLIGKSLDNVIHIQRAGQNELELTHGHRTGVVALTDLQIPLLEWMERVELLDDGKTLRVHYREKLSPQKNDLGYHDVDIEKYGLHKIIKRGKFGVYENPSDQNDPYTLKLFSKRYVIEEREPGPEGLGDDTVISKFRSCLYLKVTLTTKSRMTIDNLNLPADFQATVIRVRSALRFRHLNDVNGRQADAEELVPFDRKAQHFPVRTQATKNWATHLHPAGDPRDDFGTGIKDGKLGTCVASQHFAPNRADSESEIWPFDDQMGFFGEDKRSHLAYPNGDIEGRKAPWFMPKGAHSLQASKYISWASIFTGSNGMDRAVWVDRLFRSEDLEFKAPYWSQLMHLISITEDAQGAHEKALAFDEHTMYDREVKSIAATITSIKVGANQRRRWAAMIGYFLSFSFKYLKDELIRCRIYGALAKIPVLGKIFERKRIPHVYTKDQIHEWANTGTWYLDSIVKYVFALTPLLYIFFGFTPLPATLTFIAAWALKTAIGWPAYSYQTSKMGVSPRRTIAPFPRDIFYWYFYTPPIARGVLHIEDEGVGPFASSAQTRGVNIEPSSKRQTFWLFTAAPLASAGLGFFKLFSIMFLFKAGAAATLAGAFWPLGVAVGASILFYNLINKVWPGERPKFHQSATKFLAPFGSIVGTTALAYKALSAAAFEGSFMTGLLMNTLWPAYMFAGMVWGWIRYLKDQKIIAEVQRADRKPVTADTWKNVLREILFIDVFQRDKLRMLFPNGVKAWFKNIPNEIRDFGRNFTWGWRSS